MPLLSFYANIGRRNAKICIKNLDYIPRDWLTLKLELTEAMRKAYIEYGVIEAQWTLERHVRAQFVVWRPHIGSYIPRPFSHKRVIDAYFHAVYNPTTGEAEIKEAAFPPYHMDISMDFLALEKGRKWHVPPVVPKSFHSRTESTVQYIFEDLSTLRYPNYTRKPKPKYAREKPQIPVAHASHVRQYLPWGERLREVG